jgi:hypothetical protein
MPRSLHVRGRPSYRPVVRARIVLALLALALVPAAAATPPPHFRVFFPHQVLKPAKASSRHHSCTAAKPRSSVRLPGPKRVADLERKAIVACEQPPRSEVNAATGGLFGSFRH